MGKRFPARTIKRSEKHQRPLRKIEWVVYAKRPFAGPEAVLAYLSRYTHRIAIANSRLISCDDKGVTFKWKDSRSKGQTRHKVMTLAIPEFIRRFLIHVLPHGFHRIRHYGLFANSRRADNLTQLRQLLGVVMQQLQADTTDAANDNEEQIRDFPCPCCGDQLRPPLENGHHPSAGRPAVKAGGYK